jgi:hypothetical protein
VTGPFVVAWQAERRRHALNIGRLPGHDLREIMNAILYVDRTGVQGRYPAHGGAAQTGGERLNETYTLNRVLNGEPFYVKITN